MEIYYYLSIFPTEALIASQLEPEDFSRYMAIGSRKGHQENIIFFAVEGEFEGDFDWEFARRKCVPHSDGRPKHSVYLSVYRVLEQIPVVAIGSLYLVTPDGKSLELSPQEHHEQERRQGHYVYHEQERRQGYYVYQEMCPIRPQIVSTLGPTDFVEYITTGEHKIFVPKIVFADLKIIDFDHPESHRDFGGIYDRKVAHLQDCVNSVTCRADKPCKTLDRSGSASFTYQAINHAIYFAERDSITKYTMKSREELREHHYYWAKAANIL